MIARDDVIEMYRLILNREPESDQVINEKRGNDSISEVALGMLSSDEFIHNNCEILKSLLTKLG